MTIGLKDLFISKITMETDTEGNAIETYAKPERLAKAITVGMSTEVAEGNLYADDSIDETIKEFVSGEITINVNDIPTESYAYLLGQKIDANGVTWGSEDDDPPFVAVGFRAKKTKGLYRYVWLLKVKFAIPDENYQTKNNSITFNTPTIVGTYVKRDMDGRWKADFTGKPSEATAAVWFDQVPEYIAPDTTDPIDPPVDP